MIKQYLSDRFIGKAIQSLTIGHMFIVKDFQRKFQMLFAFAKAVLREM